MPELGENVDNSEANKKASIFMDLYIDFLGSFIPGVFATILSIIVLILSGSAFCNTICNLNGSVYSQNLSIINILSNQPWNSLSAVILFLIAGYVFGSIFYRQDPKIPDFESAKRVYDAANQDERKRLAVQPRIKNNNGENTLQLSDAQFPYFFLYEYLKGRDLDHLAKLIPWEGTKEETHKKRTKNFINLIKIRLQYLIPEKCKDIIRNEAHVRLATSVWYASRFILWTCSVSIIMVVTAIVLIGFYKSEINHIDVLLIDIFVLIAALMIKIKIEKFLHYLRVREIVFVLETAVFAEENGKKIF